MGICERGSFAQATFAHNKKPFGAIKTDRGSVDLCSRFFRAAPQKEHNVRHYMEPARKFIRSLHVVLRLRLTVLEKIAIGA